MMRIRLDSRSLSPQLLAPVAFLLLHSVPMTIERLVRSEGNNKIMINVKSWAVTVGALNPALELHSPLLLHSLRPAIDPRSFNPE